METLATRTRPAPQPTELTRPFWDGCRRHVLLVQRCRNCGRHVFVPQDYCPSCVGRELSWVESVGNGTIVTYTVVWRPQTPAFKVPYVPAVVELDEGYEMLTNVVDCDPADVRIGARVAVAFREVAPGATLPCFTLVTV